MLNFQNFKINLRKIHLLNIISIYFIISAIIYFISLFFSEIDNDLYVFLYYGQRLLEFQELLWTKEFEDKFPINQYFFTIPSYFDANYGLKNTWGFFVFFILIGASFLIYKTLDSKIFKINNKYLNNKISILVAAIFFYINIYTPSALFHINTLSSSLFAISICIFLKYSHKLKFNFLLIICSIFIMALAVSLRPYLLLAAIICFFWASIKNKNKFNIKQLLLSNFLLNLFFGIMIIIVNFLPFYLTDNIDAAIKGIFWLAKDYSYQTFFGFFSHQAQTIFSILNKTIFLLFIIYLSFIVYFILYFKKKNLLYNFDVIFLFILAPLSIEFLFLIKHFWFHYFTLFSFFISLSIGYFLCFNYGFIKKDIKLVKLPVIFLIIILSFNDLTLIFNNLNKFLKNDFNKIILSKIENFKLEESKEQNDGQIKFLYPNNMFIHWYLKEPRYGFPHHAMTVQIFNGWFENMKTDGGFNFPINKNEYCKKIQSDGPKYIFTDNLIIAETFPLIQCLQGNLSNFILYKEINLRLDKNLYIFKKI